MPCGLPSFLFSATLFSGDCQRVARRQVRFPPQTPRAYGTNRLTPAAAAGIPVHFAHSNVVGNLTVPPTNAPLPDRFYEGFPGIAKELLAARRGSPPQTPPSLTVSTKVFRGLPRNRPPPGAENFYMFEKMA